MTLPSPFGQYHGSDPLEDLLIIQWYQLLVVTEELHSTFMKGIHPLGRFLAYFQRDATLFYVKEKDRLTMTIWLEPALATVAFFGLWIARDRRYAVSSGRHLHAFLDWALDEIPVLLSMTKQAKVVDGMRGLGYSILGEIPMVWNGNESVTLGHLTRDNYRRIGQKRRSLVTIEGGE